MKMLAAMLLSLLLTSTASAACVEPKVVGSIPNDDGGEIKFLHTYDDCPADDSSRDVLGIGRTGSAIKGCWSRKGDDIVVEWSNGDTYAYPLVRVTLTADAKAYAECTLRNRGKGQKS